MCVSAARSFETLVLIDQAGGERAGVGLAQLLVGTPASGGETLRGDQHVKSVARGAEMHLASQCEVSLHGGVEGVDVTVGVLTGKDVFAGRERIEVGLVEQETDGELLVAISSAALIGEEEVLGQSVGLVPVVGDVAFLAGSPTYLAV